MQITRIKNYQQKQSFGAGRVMLEPKDLLKIMNGDKVLTNKLGAKVGGEDRGKTCLYFFKSNPFMSEVKFIKKLSEVYANVTAVSDKEAKQGIKTFRDTFGV